MSAVAPAARLPRLEHTGRVAFRNVLLAEWTKLRSVRSTGWSLFTVVLFTIGISGLACAVVVHHWSNMSLHDRVTFDATGTSLAGVLLAQLAIGVLGVLVITSEYSTGMIRASLTAVPKRLPVLWAKAAVYGAATLVVMVPLSFAAFFLGQAILSGRGADASLSDPGVLRAVFGAGLFLTAIGVFGLGLGAIVRNTAGGIALFAGLMFVLPPLMGVLPSSWDHAASPYLPLSAGGAVMTVSPGSDSLGPWVGFGVLCAYAAVSLAIAAALLVRRDV